MRLQHIVSLKHLGLSLDEIKEALETERFDLASVLVRQIELLDRRITAARALRDKLERAAKRIAAEEGLDQDEVLNLIRESVEMDKYYTPEQMEQLRQRREAVGEERIAQVQTEWTELFAALQAHMQAGDDPGDSAVQELMGKARGLIGEFTGGDPGIMASLAEMYRQEGPTPINRHGGNVDPALWEYYGRAMEAGRHLVKPGLPRGSPRVGRRTAGSGPPRGRSRLDAPQLAGARGPRYSRRNCAWLRASPGEPNPWVVPATIQTTSSASAMSGSTSCPVTNTAQPRSASPRMAAETTSLSRGVIPASGSSATRQ